MRQPNAIKAESRASNLIERFPLEPGGVVEDLAYALGIDVEPGDFRHIDAYLARRKDARSTIRVRADVREPGRWRFSIAHELGHWDLHPDRGQPFLCTGENLADYGRLPEEIEANLFAAQLLMPKDRMPAEVRRRDPDFETIGDLAHQFQVTLTAAARRFLELTEHPVILILSQNQTVRWAISNKRARSYFVERDRPVPPHSVTEEAFRQEKNPKRVEQVDPEIWFPEKSFDRDFELFEDVRYARHYGMALTLLWLPGAS